MAKAKRKSPQRTSPVPSSRKESPQTNLLELLNKPVTAYLFFAAVFVFLLWMYKPIVFEGMDVEGGDLISSIGENHQIEEFQAKTGHRPLWNPYMFGGMPIYHRHNAVSWSLDSLFFALDSLIDWRVWFLWLGAVGLFLLMKYLKTHSLAAMLAAFAFILIPHFHALIVVGHFSKLRALMWMPYVMLAFLFFLERKNLLSALLFASAFALQLRTQHYQIVFYTIMLLFAVGIAPYLKMLLDKKWADFLKVSALFVASIVLLVLIVAQPLLVTRDYTPYSTRGGNAVTLGEEVTEQDKKGVGFDYATSWSYSAAEFWNLIIPKFHGGTSQELYTGNAVPQFKNKVIPTYWGDLPFTQSYEYLGIILAFLALTGIVFQWKNPIVKNLTFLTMLALLLSVGKNYSGPSVFLSLLFAVLSVLPILSAFLRQRSEGEQPGTRLYSRIYLGHLLLLFVAIGLNLSGLGNNYLNAFFIIVYLGFIFLFRQFKEREFLVSVPFLALFFSLDLNLYQLFFYYIPYFDKFRVPMMILTLVSFNACVLAAIGLNYMIEEGLPDKESRMKFYLLGGTFLFILSIPMIFGSTFSLSQANEAQRYAAQFGPEQAGQLVEMLRKARLDILESSALRTMIFFAFAGILLFLFSRPKISKSLLVLGLLLLTAIDIGAVSFDYLKGKFINLKQVESQTFRENAVDRIIKKDDSLYRVLPPAHNDSRWHYYYQSIGGYSPAKLQIIQDLIGNGLIDFGNPRVPLNLAVAGMLNGKYITSKQPYQQADLEFLGSDPSQNLSVYRNNAVLPRAFFVDSVRVFSDGRERLEFMNSPDFNPRATALLEEPLPETVEAPDSSSAAVTLFEPDKLVLDVYTDKKALLVLSEIYYPKGWKAVLENGEELKIYKTNHLLRSMAVPAGNHTITLEFKPETYYAGVRISWAGWIITYLGLIILLYRQYGEKVRGWLKRKKAAE